MKFNQTLVVLLCSINIIVVVVVGRESIWHFQQAFTDCNSDRANLTPKVLSKTDGITALHKRGIKHNVVSTRLGERVFRVRVIPHQLGLVLTFKCESPFIHCLISSYIFGIGMEDSLQWSRA